MHPRSSICGLLIASALLLSPLHAQTHKVASPSQVTRAIAVYEWTGDLSHPTAARLIPVSLFIHGHLEDAGIYLAQPIPFALQPGNVYSIQHSGQTLGAIELESAHSHRTLADDNLLHAWYGYGRFLTSAEETEATNPQPSATPPSIANDTTGTGDATPILRHHKPGKHKKHDQQPAYVTPPTTPLLDDALRPILHSGPPSAPTPTPELTALPPGLHEAAAVSDAADSAPQTFAYIWPTSTSRAQTLQTLEALALPHLTHYIAFNNLTPAPTTTPTPGPSFVNTSTPTLINEQLLAYTLSPTSPPTYILTAESPVTTGGPIYLTLIAQPDASSQLHLTLLSITDATHLDRTPWLRPIDAVDPEATGRASLLFELRSQTTRQFALYTLTTDHAEQQLITSPIQ